MNKTKIEWVKNPDGSQGYTWNPITGCLNNCSYCYARKLANTRLKERYLANKNYAMPLERATQLLDDVLSFKQAPPSIDPFYPRYWADRLDELNPVWGQDTRSKFKGIFVCDMSDLFGIGIPEEWTRRVLGRIRLFPYHRFYLLTKQPQNLQKFSPFPDNCWVGVSITESNTDAGGYLMDIEAKVKFISFEPLLRWDNKDVESTAKALKLCGVSWVIIGALTGTYQRLIETAHKYPNLTLTKSKGTKWTLQPQIEWVEEIVQACDKAGVKVFLKNNLLKTIPGGRYNGVWRQEIPNV